MLSRPQQVHDRVYCDRHAAPDARRDSGMSTQRSAYRDYVVVAPDRFAETPESWLNFRVEKISKYRFVEAEWCLLGSTGVQRCTRTGNAFSRLTVTASVRVNVLTGAYLTVLDE